jgi:hypothetical protein
MAFPVDFKHYFVDSGSDLLDCYARNEAEARVVALPDNLSAQVRECSGCDECRRILGVSDYAKLISSM